jgi:hypothetical protein
MGGYASSVPAVAETTARIKPYGAPMGPTGQGQVATAAPPQPPTALVEDVAPQAVEKTYEPQKATALAINHLVQSGLVSPEAGHAMMDRYVAAVGTRPGTAGVAPAGGAAMEAGASAGMAPPKPTKTAFGEYDVMGTSNYPSNAVLQAIEPPDARRSRGMKVPTSGDELLSAGHEPEYATAAASGRALGALSNPRHPVIPEWHPDGFNNAFVDANGQTPEWLKALRAKAGLASATAKPEKPRNTR